MPSIRLLMRCNFNTRTREGCDEEPLRTVFSSVVSIHAQFVRIGQRYLTDVLISESLHVADEPALISVDPALNRLRIL